MSPWLARCQWAFLFLLVAGSVAAKPVDSDGDGITDSADNCPYVANPSQSNVDGDVFGDACDQCDARTRGGSLVIDAHAHKVVMNRINLAGGATQRLPLIDVLSNQVAGHLKQMVGVPFTVKETAGADPGCLQEGQAIFLVDPRSTLLAAFGSPAARAAALTVAAGSPETHAVVSHRAGATWLIGHSGRGLLRAAYSYLEELGARFLLPSPAWTLLPTLTDLAVDLDETRAPVVSSYQVFESGGHGPLTFFSNSQRNRIQAAYFADWLAARGFPLERVVETGHAYQGFYADRASALLEDPLYFSEVQWTDKLTCNDSLGAPGASACLCGPAGTGSTCQARPTYEKTVAVKINPTHHGTVPCSQPGAVVSFTDTLGVDWCEDPGDYTSEAGVVGKFTDWTIDRVAGRKSAYPDVEYGFIHVDPSDGGASLHDRSAKSAALLRVGPYGHLSNADASNADQILHLANHVAASVETFYPGVGAGFLSYSGHSAVPTVPARHNVAVQLVTGAQFGSTFTQWKLDWYAKRAASVPPFSLGFYEYVNLITARANVPTLPIDHFIDRISDWHQSGHMSFATLETTSGALPAGPYLYAASRMIWGTSPSGQAAVDEFVQAAFGPAATTMATFFDLLYGPGHLDDLRLARLFQHLSRAYADLGPSPDPAVRERLNHYTLYVEYLHRFWRLEHPVWDAGEGEIVDNEFMSIVDHLYRVHDDNLLQTWRSHFQLLVLLGLRHQTLSPSVLATYDPSSHPTGWADSLARYAQVDIDAMLAGGLANYALPTGFQDRTFSDQLVPLNPAAVPTYNVFPSIGADRSSNRYRIYSDGVHDTKIWVYTNGNCALYDPNNLGQLVVQDQLGAVLASVPFSLTAGQGLYTAHPDFVPSGWRVCVDDAYSLGVLPQGVHDFFFEAPSGTLRLTLGIPDNTPFVTAPLLQAFGIAPGNRAYFYVPPGTQKIWLNLETLSSHLRFYPPSQPGGVVPTLELGSTLYSIDVPPGDDDSVWSINQYLSQVVQLLNVPDYLSPSPDQLLVPVDALSPAP